MNLQIAHSRLIRRVTLQLDTICALALAIGPDNLAIFVPVVLKQMQRHKIQHEKFSKLAAKLLNHDPPCMSNAADWEANNAWLEELIPPIVRVHGQYDDSLGDHLSSALIPDDT